MTQRIRIHVVSDIHYASPAEQKRRDFEWAGVASPVRRFFTRLYQKHIWLSDPFAHNHLIDRFCEQPGNPDWVISNGDHGCDSAFLGASDDATLESVRLCLGKLRGRFGSQLRCTIGDHELGKVWLHARIGGMRLESWKRCTGELKMSPFWRLDLGCHTILGLTSSLLELPLLEPDTLPNEWEAWKELSTRHWNELRKVLGELPDQQKLILFIHDPSALPYLAADPVVRSVLPRVELTIIGHLHTQFVFQTAKVLAGIPPIRRFGVGARRISTALNRASTWKEFKVRLCPSLAGIELTGHGGYGVLELDPAGQAPAKWKVIPLPRR